MRIITKEGNRVDGKATDKSIKRKLKEDDPIIRNAEKGNLEEMSPMDPPDAYDKDRTVDVDYNDLHPALQELLNEHNDVIEKCDAFEKALIEFKRGGFFITKEINKAFNEFFVAFDEEVMPHNRKEEKGLFPILKAKLLETGEHSTGANPHTPVDLMEDDHIKMIQLASLSFNFLGLAMRLRDKNDIAVTFDIAYNNGKELAELLKLHIYREDHIIFPLAQQLLTAKELEITYG